MYVEDKLTLSIMAGVVKKTKNVNGCKDPSLSF